MSRDAAEPRPLRPSVILAVLLGIAVVWLAFPNRRDLLQPDEGRYGEIPREMLASGDWITPRLDGFLYFEKPPLQYWGTAAAFAVFGVGNASARAWPLALGLLTVLFVWRLGRRLYGEEIGATAGILLASGALWFAMGHTLTLDTGLSAFLFLAIGALAWAQTLRDHPARLSRWMLLAWAALGLAVLSKGPVALVLAGGTVLAYGFLARDLAIWKHLRLASGLAVLGAIAAPWFVVVSRRDPDFARFFFLHENLERYTTEVHRRVEPWWTYVPVLVLGSLPWIRPSVASLAVPGFEPRSRGVFDPARLLWIYGIVTVLFFSFSQSKLVPYVQPVFPALAILAARHLARRPGLGFESALVLLLGASLAVVPFVPLEIDLSSQPPDVIARCRPYVLAAAVSLIAGGALVRAARMRGLRGVAVLGLAMSVAFHALLLAHQVLAPVKSAREIARAIDTNVPRDAPVFDVGRYDQPLPFYLGRTVELVAYRGELDYGLSRAPEREIRDLRAFQRIWTDLDQAAAVFSKDGFAAAVDAGIPMRKVFEDPRRVVAVRR